MRIYSLVNTLLVSLGTASAADYVARDMDRWCITYLSTYLAPVSDLPGSSPSRLSTLNWNSSIPATSGIDDRTSLISESAGTSAVGLESSSVDMALTETQTDSLTLPFGSTTGSLTDTIITSLMSTTNLNTAASPTSSGIVEPPGRSVIFLIRGSDNQKRDISKRATGGFVGQDNPDVCTFASTFNLAEGQLFSGGVPVYYSGEEFKELGGEGEGPPVSGSITRTFDTDGRTLVFRNPELPNGEAGFCQDSSGQVYLTFTTEPSNCVPVTLAVYDVVQCQDGRLVGVDTSTTSGIVTETSTAAEVSSSSAGGEESMTSEATVSTEHNSRSLSQTESSGRSSEASTFEASTTVSSEVINSSASTSSIQSSILSIDSTTGTLSSMESEVSSSTINTSTGSASQPSSEPTGSASLSTSSSSEQTTPNTSTTTSDSSSEIDATTAESSSEIYTSTTEFSSEPEGTTTLPSSETEGTTSLSSSETEGTTAQSSSEIDTSTTEATTTTGQETTAADTTTDLVMTTTSEFSSDIDTSTTEATTTADSETTTATTADTTTDVTSTTASESSSNIDTSTTEVTTTTGPETSTADTTTDLTTTTSSGPEPGSCASLSNPYYVDGYDFNLSCNTDVTSFGVSIGEVQANSFSQCVLFCAESSNCGAIRYTKSNMLCHGYGSISGTAGDNLYDVAVKVVPTTTTSADVTTTSEAP